MQATAQQPFSALVQGVRVLRRLNPDRVVAFFTLLPSLILVGIFVYGFIGQTFAWSLTDWQGLQANPVRNYVGFQNYEDLFSGFMGARFRQELVNTFFFTLFFLTGCLTLGFLLAVLLDQNIKGEGFFRTVFLFPMALSFAVTGTIWRWLLDPRGGVNVLPELFGAKALGYRWINYRHNYTFNWHEVPLLTTVLVVGLLVLIVVQQLRNRRYLATIFFGVPVVLVLLWIVQDWLLWNPAKPQMHGEFNWQDVPRYVGATLLSGFVLYVIHALWNGRRRAALLAGVPALVLLIWYVAGGPDRFPNIMFPEQYGYKVALNGVIIAATWQMSGYTMAMYLAGIRGIPEELREAARVDGCTEWQIYMKIVLPMLRPITLSAAIVLGHISLKIFDLIFAMVGIDHWPVSVPGVQMYVVSFRGNQFAIGSTIAIVLLVMVASVIIPYLVTSLRSEHEA